MKVYALVGPSGTGKSHRAIMVAHEYQAEMIIDDGLIIKNGRILAGQTAKRRPTRIGAIKAALFLDPTKAEEARRIIKQENPAGILVLATSTGMAEKIVENLSLPPVDRFISIEEIASPEEIKSARLMRTRYARHVIPAPTVEVRKSFPGTIIEPLQVFFRRKNKPATVPAKSWLEQSVVRPTFTFYGRLSISRPALESIIAISARQVNGITAVSRPQIEQNQEGINIHLQVSVRLELNLTEPARRVQQEVKRAVEHMTALPVNRVDVLIKDISF
ncbi:MAG: Asp23/Gls24 family envelope stress response protein [Bacillota bacterium]